MLMRRGRSGEGSVCLRRERCGELGVGIWLGRVIEGRNTHE